MDSAKKPLKVGIDFQESEEQNSIDGDYLELADELESNKIAEKESQKPSEH